MDGWLSSKRAYYHDQYMRKALQEGLAEAEASKKAAIQTDRAMTQLNQNIFAVNYRLDSATQAVNENGNNISNIAKQLTDPNLDPQKKIELTSNLDYYQKCFQSAIIKQNEASQEMKNLSSYNDPDIIKSDFSELFNHLTDFID
jgi:CII-binding regulator of phage lambda lysogenization HflD